MQYSHKVYRLISVLHLERSLNGHWMDLYEDENDSILVWNDNSD